MIVPSSSQFEIQLLHHRTKVASEVHIVASTFSHGRSTHAFLNYRVITWWSGVPNGAKSCACKSTRVSEGETPYPPTACINSKMWDSLAKTIKSTNQAEVKKRKLWVSPLERWKNRRGMATEHEGKVDGNQPEERTWAITGWHGTKKGFMPWSKLPKHLSFQENNSRRHTNRKRKPKSKKWPKIWTFDWLKQKEDVN